MSTTATKHQSDKSTILLSKKGMKELRKSISQLEHDRMAIRRSLRESDKTTSHDDRFERSDRLLRLEVIESELIEKQHILNHAQIISSRSKRMKVAIGSVVDLIDQQGRIIRYTLVESVEANPSDGRISAASPLGSTLIGKTVQDIVEWSNGLHHAKFQLIKIT